MKPIIGIDIGGTFMKGGLVKDGTLMNTARIKTEHKNEKEFFTNAFKLIDEILSVNNMKPVDIGGIGVGVAGMVLADLGIVVSAVNLGLSNVNLSQKISDKYGVEVRIGNDVGMFALAEQAASGLDNLVYVAIGTGINAGVINSGKLFSGANGASIEFGHSAMGDILECSCGLTGCVESYVSGKAIMAAAKEYGIPASRPEDVFALVPHLDFATEKNHAAFDIIDGFIKSVTTMLANLCNLYRPQVIFIGGGIAPLVAPYLKLLNKNLAACCYGYKNAPKVEVKISDLSWHGGIIGAALLFPKTENKVKKYC